MKAIAIDTTTATLLRYRLLELAHRHPCHPRIASATWRLGRVSRVLDRRYPMVIPPSTGTVCPVM